MPALEDMLDPSDRQRLELLAEPDVRDIAAGARQAAAESTGTGRVAWCIVALALDYSGGSPETARGLIGALVHDDRVRHLAQACLTTLTSDGDTTTGTP